MHFILCNFKCSDVVRLLPGSRAVRAGCLLSSQPFGRHAYKMQPHIRQVEPPNGWCAGSQVAHDLPQTATLIVAAVACRDPQPVRRCEDVSHALLCRACTQRACQGKSSPSACEYCAVGDSIVVVTSHKVKVHPSFYYFAWSSNMPITFLELGIFFQGGTS